MLAIIISPDTVVTPHQGIVEWQGESFSQSVEVYFRDSEQLPTRLWLAINDTTAVGLLLQMMPKKGEQKSKCIEGDDDWERMIHLTKTITPEELLLLDNQTILYRLYSQEKIEVFPSMPVTFGCTCSIERGENSILMLGQEEIEQELEDKKKIVVICEFCNKEYVFDRVDIAYLFKKIDGFSALH
jgi:molecular chaperone Hsp33